MKNLPDLQDDYYVTNFHTLVGYVNELYADLLTHEEKQWYVAICNLPTQAQRLYIRLLTRKGSIFRLTRLNYSDIGKFDLAAMELEQSHLATCEPPDTLSALLQSYTKPELVSLLSLETLRRLSRPDLVAHIEHDEISRQSIFIKLLQDADRWITLNGHCHWMLMQLCFFGNLYQDSSEFIVSQLGNQRYEDYAIDPSARAFTSRKQIESHWRYFECDVVYSCSVDKSSVEELLNFNNQLPACGDDATLLRRVHRLRTRVARQLERLGERDKALALYELCNQPPARERRVRLLVQKKQWHDALELATQMLCSPYTESERLVAQRLQGRCFKELGMVYDKPVRFEPVTKEIVLIEKPMRVEELARQYFAQSGECFHTENTLVNGVLGLFLWDIVFHPVPGVFYNPFQSAPADFYQPEFFQSRRKLIDTRLRELKDESCFRARVLNAASQHHGKQNPLVRWHGLSPELLELALTRIPVAHWSVLFGRILSDIREHSKGMPDLVQFAHEGGYEFIEIKGPGDTLQPHQRRWMEYVEQHGIPCRVTHVSFCVDQADVSSSHPTGP